MRLFRFAFLALLLLAGVAHAEDAQDVRGNYVGCKDVTATGSWVSYTSADLENAAGSAVLGSGLYYTEVALTQPSASVYLCHTAAGSCGADTTNKRSVASGAALVVPMRGLGVQTIALRAANGTTVQLCAYFRASP